MSYFKNKQEVWDEATCEKFAKKVPKDAFGNKYHLPGFYLTYPPMAIGKVRYNGGCCRNKSGKPVKWYEGEIFYLPKVTKNFKWVYIPTWFWRLVKKEKRSQKPLDK